MLNKGVKGLVPFGSLVGIGIDELIDVEVLKGVNLVLTHGAIFPPQGYKREIGACEIDQR
jgi:hypothetical protein